MGLFDTVKLKANALAADAERAGKITAAQARSVVLQNDIRKAERELGHATFALIESGELAHPSLDASADVLRQAHQALADKEHEIAALRGEIEAADDTVTPSADVGAPASAVSEAEGEASPEAGSEAEAPPEAGSGAEAEAGAQTSAAPEPEPRAKEPAASPKDAPADGATTEPAG